MKLSKTGIKELTARYRSVLLKCIAISMAIGVSTGALAAGTAIITDKDTSGTPTSTTYTITAGENVTITSTGTSAYTISATDKDTTYTAKDKGGVTVSNTNEISVNTDGTTIKINDGGNLSVGKIQASNIDGLTATADELNVLDGITASTAELNYMDGVTSNVQTQLDAKADAADVYTKSDMDTKLGTKANANDVYTKSETDTKLGTKANATDVYTKSETDTKLGAKANAADVYTKTDMDTKLDAKLDDSQLVTSLSSTSTDTEIASAKATYDAIEAAKTDTNNKIGNLSSLTTDAQTTLVAAINEVDAHANTAQTTADNAANMSYTGGDKITLTDTDSATTTATVYTSSATDTLLNNKVDKTTYNTAMDNINVSTDAGGVVTIHDDTTGSAEVYNKATMDTKLGEKANVADTTVADGTYNYISAGTGVANNLVNLDTQVKVNADVIDAGTLTTTGVLKDATLGSGVGKLTVAESLEKLSTAAYDAQTTADNAANMTYDGAGKTFSITDTNAKSGTEGATITAYTKTATDDLVDSIVEKTDEKITFKTSAGTEEAQSYTIAGADAATKTAINARFKAAESTNSGIKVDTDGDGNVDVELAGVGKNTFKDTQIVTNGSGKAVTLGKDGTVTATDGFTAGTHTSLVDGTLTVGNGEKSSTLTSTKLSTTDVAASNSVTVGTKTSLTDGNLTLGDANTITGKKVSGVATLDMNNNALTNVKGLTLTNGETGTDLKTASLSVDSNANLASDKKVVSSNGFEVSANNKLDDTNGLTASQATIAGALSAGANQFKVDALGNLTISNGTDSVQAKTDGTVTATGDITTSSNLVATKKDGANTVTATTITDNGIKMTKTPYGESATTLFEVGADGALTALGIKTNATNGVDLGIAGTTTDVIGKAINIGDASTENVAIAGTTSASLKVGTNGVTVGTTAATIGFDTNSVMIDATGTTVTGDESVSGTLTADGVSSFGKISGTSDYVLNVDNTASEEKVTVTGALDVTGLASLDGGIDVNGAMTVDAATGNIKTDGTLTADGATAQLVKNDADKYVVDVTKTKATINGALTATGDLKVGDKFTIVADEGSVSAADGKFYIDSDGGFKAGDGSFKVDYTGNLSVNGNKFTVDSLTGNTYAAGTLTGADGNFTVDQNGDTETKGTLTVAKAATMNGLVTANAGLTVTAGQNFTLGGTAVNAINTGAASADAKTLATMASVKAQAENGTYTNTVADSNITATTIGGAIANIDTTLGNIAAVDGTDATGATGNLAGKGSTVADHLNAIDTRMGQITGLANADGTVNHAKSTNTNTNLAVGTTISDHLVNLDNAIGDRNYTSTHYIKSGSTVSSALSTLDDAVNDVDNRVSTLDRRTRGGFASLAAMSALQPNSRACGNTQLSAGTGTYRGRVGMALGAFHYFNDEVMMNLGASYAGSTSATLRAGVTFGL